MSLKDRLAQPPAAKPRPCAVRDWLETITDAAELEAGMEMLMSDWSSQAIQDAFASEGYPNGLETIRKHRTGRCSCR